MKSDLLKGEQLSSFDSLISYFYEFFSKVIVGWSIVKVYVLEGNWLRFLEISKKNLSDFEGLEA